MEAMYYVQKLFLSLQHVKNLELGPRCFKVLSALLRRGLWIPIPKQDCLRLKLQMDKLSLSLVLRLLGSFPDLETLVIERTYLPYPAGVGRGSYASYLLKCDLLHLKSVDIKNFEESDIAGEPILKLVQLLLDKAMVLEKMVIKVNDLRGLSSTHNSSDYIKITRTLLSYPRSSLKAVVVLR
ncbi:hypothetical protein BUALT_Bualt01G0118100 [Buddleja alternifolia]|uniref:FBD domain-containing protein n=1 Tax=Buddleja alternifolia TaxID=168488 RepID=A0AAV6Y6D9_9LAMI|nr:hypothetical protein BUALT_Bualt01G0118100 [Buddleja alternifolia]